MRTIINCRAIVGILLLGLISCEKNRDESVLFQMRNDTNAEIAKAEIFAYDGSGVIRSLATTTGLAKGATYTQRVGLGSLLKTEGGYEIQIEEAKKKRSYRFGYFDNGTDFRSEYAVGIKSDTIKVDFVNRDL